MDSEETTNLNQNPLDQQFTHQFGQPQQQLPNSSGVLVLGILSIVFSILFFCYFIPTIISLALGIIALSLAPSANRKYKEAPHLYTIGSYNNLKAGKICAIIGLSFSALIFILFIIGIFFYASILGGAFQGFSNQY
jgi:presenilin-like A22 family membrane protease